MVGGAGLVLAGAFAMPIFNHGYRLGEEANRLHDDLIQDFKTAVNDSTFMDRGIGRRFTNTDTCIQRNVIDDIRSIGLFDRRWYARRELGRDWRSYVDYKPIVQNCVEEYGRRSLIVDNLDYEIRT